MDYPEDFPDDLREHVETAIAQAEIDLVEQRKRLGPRFETQWQGILLLWVKTIFFEFAERACDMGRRGDWSAEKIRKETSAYLKKLAAHARSRHAPPSSFTIPYMADQELKKISEAITRFDEWTAFQERVNGTREILFPPHALCGCVPRERADRRSHADLSRGTGSALKGSSPPPLSLEP